MPSRTVESEPENVLNTLSPGRNSRWILPEELETPNRPTGRQPHLVYNHRLAHRSNWVQVRSHENTVFPLQVIHHQLNGEMSMVEPEMMDVNYLVLYRMVKNQVPVCPKQAVQQQDELNDAHSPFAPPQQEPLLAAPCVNGTLVRPVPSDEESPSTACRQSEVCAPGGVQLGRGVPGVQHSPGAGSGGGGPPPPGGGQKEEVQRRGEPRHSHQEEEQAIQDLLHLHLQVFHNLHVRQIHGVHLIDRGKPFQS